MRITGLRLLTTVHEWGRPVGDANGVFAGGTTPVPILLVDTDEGITGVGLGSHVAAETLFAAIEGEDPRAVTARASDSPTSAQSSIDRAESGSRMRCAGSPPTDG